MHSDHSILQSFKFAYNGLKESFKAEPNLRIHFSLGTLAVILGFLLHISLDEWAILVTTITFVIVAELLNTVLENIVDMVSPEVQEKAKIAKDVSAAVVLIMATTSVVIGLIIFLPRIAKLI